MTNSHQIADCKGGVVDVLLGGFEDLLVHSHAHIGYAKGMGCVIVVGAWLSVSFIIHGVCMEIEIGILC
ncbi:hypothetical protein BDV25DRAFT_154937 [Aspergillus avenaceus]|uniref:Uncharacterized protein n=1 Tax=Aspergillus avenaceus TaxID=36643 RepID=A0A5N6TUZ8_ASPAV|nr:hypothetical protein BDV25DRAFT_154937 [Aspergillus avenaceus]